MPGREEFERSVGQLFDDFAREFERAKEESARETAEALNRTVRRLRRSTDVDETLGMLVDGAAAFSRRSAGIRFAGTEARVVEARGFARPEAGFEIARAAAVMAAIETEDPVVAAATENELSPSFFAVAMRDVEPSELAYFFPLVTAGSVKGMLFAAVAVQAAALEALSEAAALRWEMLDAEERARPKPQAEFVKIETPVRAARAWTDLAAGEQALHLKAQRFAKVRVAEMRVANATAVRAGQENADLYRRFKPSIDTAREVYRLEFLEGHAAMPDYLYLELVRSLADDDDTLLGPDFPGRLA